MWIYRTAFTIILILSILYKIEFFHNFLQFVLSLISKLKWIRKWDFFYLLFVTLVKKYNDWITKFMYLRHYQKHFKLLLLMKQSKGNLIMRVMHDRKYGFNLYYSIKKSKTFRKTRDFIANDIICKSLSIEEEIVQLYVWRLVE